MIFLEITPYTVYKKGTCYTQTAKFGERTQLKAHYKLGQHTEKDCERDKCPK